MSSPHGVYVPPLIEALQAPGAGPIISHLQVQD